MEETVGRTKTSLIAEWITTGELPDEIIQIAKVSKEAEREFRLRALELSLKVVPIGNVQISGLYESSVRKTAKELITDAEVILNYIKNGA